MCRDRGAPCLWLFNMLTRRWRSNDLTLKANEWQSATVSAKIGDHDSHTYKYTYVYNIYVYTYVYSYVYIYVNR
jgi:hypothetical protein